MKKTYILVLIMMLFLSILFGCAEEENVAAKSISFSEEVCEIYEKSVNFPQIFLNLNNGTTKPADPDDFWYIPKDAATGELIPYIYVLEGVIILNREDSPKAFSALIEVVHKSDNNLKSVMHVEKIQTDLEFVHLTSEYNRRVCFIGKSLQFFVQLVPVGGFSERPEGTSFTDVQFFVSWDNELYPGRCASVTDTGGLLTVYSAAKAGMILEVTVRVTAQNGTVKAASMQITVERANMM